MPCCIVSAPPHLGWFSAKYDDPAVYSEESGFVPRSDVGYCKRYIRQNGLHATQNMARSDLHMETDSVRLLMKNQNWSDRQNGFAGTQCGGRPQPCTAQGRWSSGLPVQPNTSPYELLGRIYHLQKKRSEDSIACGGLTMPQL